MKQWIRQVSKCSFASSSRTLPLDEVVGVVIRREELADTGGGERRRNGSQSPGFHLEDRRIMLAQDFISPSSAGATPLSCGGNSVAQHATDYSLVLNTENSV
jgi:hypothetical protein